MIIQGALKKLFKLRQKSADAAHERKRKGKGSDEGYDPAEMPFLDHLEDLRKMFFKIMITLIVSMTVCFTFNTKLLDLIRLPMQWAKIGDGGPAFFVTETGKEDEEAIKLDDWIVTSSGILGKVRAVGDLGRTYTIALGTSMQGEGGLDVIFKSSAIQSKIQAPANLGENQEVTLEDMLSRQNFLVMEVFQPYEALVLTLKLAFFVGIVLAFPLLVYFIAQFVLPGLRQQEKKVIFPALALAFVLFIVGAGFAFRVGLPMALNFLAEYTISRGIEPGWRIGYYIKFVTQVCLVFGMCFELPVVVLVLVKLELLTFRTMRDSRAYAIVILMIISAVFTPPDPMTLVLLSVPLIILYEICIWIAWFMERAQRKVEKEEEERKEKERLELEAKLAALPPADDDDEADDKGDGDEKRIDGDVVKPQPDPHLHDYGADHDEHGNYIGSDSDPYGHEGYDHGHHGHAGPNVIDINNCSLEELQKLPGVGPKLAERLMESRPFYSEDELEYHAYIPESVRKLIVERIYYG